MTFEKKTVDFLVVGAQKSGTTTAYHLLRSHPDLFLPQAKEVAFFSSEGKEKYHLGTDWYLQEYFDFAKPNQLIGEASPQYMSCLYAAQRIAKHNPKMRIVVLLRNPIDRAYSAYRMLIKMGLETHSFSEVVQSTTDCNKLLAPDEYLQSKGGDNSSYYYRMGMYANLLRPYLELFGKDQVHIEFMETLHREPAIVMSRIYKFIGADATFISPSIGQRFHEGGTTGRFKALPTALIWGQKVKQRLPAFLRKRLHGIGYWLEQKNVVAEKPQPMLASDRKILADLYRREVEELQSTWGLTTPWNDFKS